MSAQTEQNNSGTTMDAYRRWVEDLAVKQRAQHALRCLMRVGAQTTPALLEGLGHPDHEVRIGCCKVLDHYLDPAALPELIRNLNHEDERVRAWATSRWRVTPRPSVRFARFTQAMRSSSPAAPSTMSAARRRRGSTR